MRLTRAVAALLLLILVDAALLLARVGNRLANDTLELAALVRGKQGEP